MESPGHRAFNKWETNSDTAGDDQTSDTVRHLENDQFTSILELSCLSLIDTRRGSVHARTNASNDTTGLDYDD